MKVLMISTDARILEEGSLVRARMQDYGELADELHIIVFTQRDVSLPRPSPYDKGRAREGIQLSKNVWLYPTSSRKRIMAPWDGAKIALPLLRRWKTEKARVVVTSQDGFANCLALPLAKLYGAGLEVQIHTDVFSAYFARTFFLKLHKLSYKVALKFATVVRVVSERVKQSLLTRGVPAWKIRVVPVFIQPRVQSRDQRIDLRAKYPNWQNILVWVGRMSEEKNPLLALAVLERVLKRFPNTGLIFVGDGSLRALLETEIERFSLTENVTCIGWQTNITPYLQVADIYLCTSDFEGYGLSLIEAALAQVPIVSTDVGVVGELLNEHNVLSAPPRDATKLSEKTMFLLQNSGARGMMRDRLAGVASELPEKAKLLARIKEAWTWAARPVTVDIGANVTMLFKYIISGGSAAVVNLGLLYVFTDLLHIWYLLSAILSFLIAFGISFGLQKFWTFQDMSREGMHKQASIYMLVALINLGFNTLIIYLLVDKLHLWYMLAALIAGGLIALWSFFVYRKFIFKKK